MKKSTYIIVLAWISFSITQAYALSASYLISPPAVNFHFDRSLVKTFMVSNRGLKTLRLNVRTIYYPVGVPHNFLSKDKALSPSTDDITSYMRLSPKRLVLKPGDVRKVRLFIHKPNFKMHSGTYRGYVEFSMIPPKISAVRDYKFAKGITTSMNVLFKQVSGVYAQVGSGDARATQLTCSFSPKQPGRIYLTINNTSDWWFTPRFTVLDARSRVVKKGLDIVPVMRNSEGQRQVAWLADQSSSQYTLKWQIGGQMFSRRCSVAKSQS